MPARPAVSARSGPGVPEDERRGRRLGEQAKHREHLQGGGNLPHTPVIGRSGEFVQRTAELPWPFREPAVRPPARPLRVLDPRRGVPDPGARAQGGGARDARRVAHRPRLDGGRDRPPQGRRRPGRQADLRLRGVRRRRPQGPEEGPRAPDAPGRRQHGLREPRQALLARLPRGLLLQAARRLGAARAPRAGPDRALRLPLGSRLARAERASRRQTPRRSSTVSRRSSGATRPTSSSRTSASRHSSSPTRVSPVSPRSRSSRSSRRATSTTSTRPTPSATTRCSASSRATR